MNNCCNVIQELIPGAHFHRTGEVNPSDRQHEIPTVMHSELRYCEPHYVSYAQLALMASLHIRWIAGLASAGIYLRIQMKWLLTMRRHLSRHFAKHDVCRGALR